MFPTHKDIRLAIEDIRGGFAAWPLWGTIGWQDIRQRYRRSIIGPFWVTIGMAVNVAAIGLVWGTLFRFNREEFIPYLTIGVLVWFFITDSLREGTNCFITSASLIKQMRNPYSNYVLLVIWRNILIFAHHFVIYVFVALLFLIVPSPAALLLPLAVLLILTSVSWAVLLFGMLSTRFRDVPLVVSNILSIAFFVTPIMWKPSQLGSRAYIADFNPFTHLIALIREPLLGGYPPLLSWGVAIAISVLGWSVAFLFFAAFRKRLAYWL